jgi:hypothetical protein
MEQYPNDMFKVSVFKHWIVVVSGGPLMEELARLPDDVVSFEEATGKVCYHTYLRSRIDAS